ncbi:MAG: M55 family metallopeptidase [Gemmatimonadota bacterium]|nr:M55 family metallopeptidase [Gemmatimonadota bacterium]
MRRLIRFAQPVVILCLALAGRETSVAQERPLKIFISVDMEGIGGIGTAAMTSATGKDYATGRELMTAEVNAVIAAIKRHGRAEILVNDSHGDHQNLLHTELPADVEYIQGALKPFGMMEGLTRDFDGVILLGCHARAGAPYAFLSHTGSSTLEGLWINGVEVGEGGMNAHYAGSLGVPVLLASGDSAFVEEFAALGTGARLVTTKHAIGHGAARLLHPEVVRERLALAIGKALPDTERARPMRVKEPVALRLRFNTVTRADIAESIPGVGRVDGVTVEYRAATMAEGQKLIRLMYRYLDW